MKEGIPVIPGVLLPSVATASTFTAGSGGTEQILRSQSGLSISPSPLLSSLRSHHTRARSLRAGCPGEPEGGLSPALDRPHTSLQPRQAQPIFSAGPAVLWVWHSELGVGLSSAACTEHRAPVPAGTQGSVTPSQGGHGHKEHC